MQVVKSGMHQISWRQDKQVYLRKKQILCLSTIGTLQYNRKEEDGHWGEHPGEV